MLFSAPSVCHVVTKVIALDGPWCGHSSVQVGLVGMSLNLGEGNGMSPTCNNAVLKDLPYAPIGIGRPIFRCIWQLIVQKSLNDVLCFLLCLRDVLTLFVPWLSLVCTLCLVCALSALKLHAFFLRPLIQKDVNAVDKMLDMVLAAADKPLDA